MGDSRPIIKALCVPEWEGEIVCAYSEKYNPSSRIVAAYTFKPQVVTYLGFYIWHLPQTTTSLEEIPKICMTPLLLAPPIDLAILWYASQLPLWQIIFPEVHNAMIEEVFGWLVLSCSS